LHLGALWALAVAEPLFDLIRKNPDFLAARGMSGRDVVPVVERIRGRGRSSGVDVEMRTYSVYWAAEDGKLRMRKAFTTREAALEAAGLRE
jgi:hypothetical protein